MYYQYRVLVVLLLCSLSITNVSAKEYSAGYKRIYLETRLFGEYPMAIWYPTEEVSRQQRLGPFTMDIALAAPVAGGRFPLVLFSHGSGGSNMAHRDTANLLARNGFIAAAILHPKNNYQNNSAQGSLENWINRPKHISAALDYLLSERSFAASIDVEHIAVVGHSIGGYTALALLGAKANTAAIVRHCRQNAKQDQAFCTLPGHSTNTVPVRQVKINQIQDQRVKAAVAMAPVGVIFSDRRSLASIDKPILLFQAGQDDILKSPFHAEYLRQHLQGRIDYQVVDQAGHFSFIAPFPESLQEEVGPAAIDPRGFDRAAFHQKLNRRILRFMQKNLLTES